MRRPLCLIGLAFVLILLTGILWIPHGAETFEELDKETVTVLGVVEWKERKSRNGEETLVVSLEQVVVLKAEQVNYLTQIISDSEKKSRNNVKQIKRYCEKKKQDLAREDTEKIEGLMCYMEESAADGKEVAIGSLVVMQGQFRALAHATNPGEFDMADYYGILGVQGRIFQSKCLAQGESYDYFREKLYEVKSYLSLLLDASYPAEKATIMRAMLLGEKGMLEEEVKSLYQQSGIIHILAISGLHLSLLGMGLHKLLARLRFPKGLNIFLCVAFMYCYGMMTGMGVSVVRAFIMFALHLGAGLFGRTYDMLTAVTVAAFVLLLRQPLYLEHSGFLFSFGAICGIGLFLPAVERNLPCRNKAVKSLFAGIGVSLSTLPVYLLFYYEFPLYSVLLNLLVIPCMGIVLTGGIVTLFVAAVFLPLAKYTAVVSSLVLVFYEKCCTLCLRLPGHKWITGAPRGWQVAAFVAILAILTVWSEKTQNMQKADGAQDGGKAQAGGKTDGVRDGGKVQTEGKVDGARDGGKVQTEGKVGVVQDGGKVQAKQKGRRLWIAGKWHGLQKWQFWTGVLTAALVLVLRFPHGLEITMLDIGQGDCIYIAEGRGHFLIDGGSSSKKNIDDYQIAPFLKYKGVDRLDGVFVTHPDSDHENGIRAILEEYEETGIRIGTLFLPDVAQESKNENYLRLEELAQNAGVPVHYLSSGERLRKGKVMLTCIHPDKGYANEDVNAYSIVLYLTYENFSALFTGDLEGEGERLVTEKLSDGGSCVTLLKVAHHGSKNSTPTEFLQAVTPRIALISAGRDNSYGHPHEETLERLAAHGCRIYQTPESGAVTIWTDGRRVEAETYVR